MGRWSPLNYNTEEEKGFLRTRISKMISPGSTFNRAVPEKIFVRAIQDYNVEAVYFSETLPSIILSDNWELRREFITNSGFDISRIEEIEGIYCSKNNLSSDYISSIAAAKGLSQSWPDK